MALKSSVASLTLLLLLAVLCFSNVSSLKCYSCFSYNSDKECESRYNLKEIECDKEYDTCLKFEMEVTVREKSAGKLLTKTNKGYARYCGSKTKDCSDSVVKPSICSRMYHKIDATVHQCKITCCDKDLKSKCHERPHWPGTQQSSSIFNNTVVGKGQRGRGSMLTVSIWFTLVLGAVLKIML